MTNSLITGFASGFVCVLAAYMVAVPIRFLYKVLSK